MESLICSFYLSVAARKIVCADPSPEIHSHVAGTLSNQQTNSVSVSVSLSLSMSLSQCLFPPLSPSISRSLPLPPPSLSLSLNRLSGLVVKLSSSRTADLVSIPAIAVNCCSGQVLTCHQNNGTAVATPPNCVLVKSYLASKQWYCSGHPTSLCSGQVLPVTRTMVLQ